MTKKKKSIFDFLFGEKKDKSVGSTTDTILEQRRREQDEDLEQGEPTMKPENKKVNMAEQPKVYSDELSLHKRLSGQYHEQEVEYKQNLTDYLKLYSDLKQSLAALSQLEQNLSTKKKTYLDELANYQTTQLTYERTLADYQKVSEELEEVSKERKEAQKSFDEKNRKLEISRQKLGKLEKQFSEKSVEYNELQETLQRESQEVDGAQSRLTGLLAVYSVMEKNYNEKKAAFDAAENRYNRAQLAKNELQTLTQDFEKTQHSKNAAEANLASIEKALKEYEKVEKIQSTSQDFLAENFADMQEKYQAHKEKYEKTLDEFTLVKKKYDVEFANYSQVKKNYEETAALPNPSRMVLHYLGEEFEAAQAKIDELDVSYKPLEENYKLQKEIFEQIDGSFQVIKKVADEKQAKYISADQRVKETQNAYNRAKMVTEVVSSQYQRLNQQRAAAEANYEEVAKDYEQLEKDYEKSKQNFLPLKEEFLPKKEQRDSAQAACENAQKQLKQTQEKLAVVKEAFDDLQNWLQVAKEEADKAEKERQNSQEKLQNLVAEVQKNQEAFHQNLELTETIYAKGDRQYHALVDQYVDWTNDYKNYNHDYQVMSPFYDSVKSKMAEVSAQYGQLEQQYKKFIQSDEQIHQFYSQKIKEYDTEKDFYDRVTLEYRRCAELYQTALRQQEVFERSSSNMKKFLVQDNRLTFPIYEATGYNFVDEFNIPKVHQTAEGWGLQDKSQFFSWNERYQALQSELDSVAAQFASSLKNYQNQLSVFLQVGGQRIKELGNPSEAYKGIEVQLYSKNLANKVVEWRAEYARREQVFVPLVRSYEKYLDELRKLSATLQQNAQTKNGLQFLIELVNSFANYTDMYSSVYRNIDYLAQVLQVSSTDLTKLKASEELKSLLQEKYYQRAMGMINVDLGSFSETFNRTRQGYDQSLADLKYQLVQLEKATGISTSQIKIENAFPDNLHLKEYFEKVLKDNYDALISMVVGSSSLINCVKKVKRFERVANTFANEEVDNALAFPERKLTIPTKELETGLEIYGVKNIVAPIRPEEPEKAYAQPEQPKVLPEKPVCLEKISGPNKMTKEHGKVVEIAETEPVYLAEAK